MAEFRPAKVGDKIRLTGKGLGNGTTKPGDIVVVTEITPTEGVAGDMIRWGAKGGQGVFNAEGRFEFLEDDDDGQTANTGICNEIRGH